MENGKSYFRSTSIQENKPNNKQRGKQKSFIQHIHIQI